MRPTLRTPKTVSINPTNTTLNPKPPLHIQPSFDTTHHILTAIMCPKFTCMADITSVVLSSMSAGVSALASTIGLLVSVPSAVAPGGQGMAVAALNILAGCSDAITASNARIITQVGLLSTTRPRALLSAHHSFPCVGWSYQMKKRSQRVPL